MIQHQTDGVIWQICNLELIFLHAIQRLPVKVDFLPRSHKDVWLRWLSEYRDSAYDRANPNRSAQFIYDKINLPEMIIWLAAASGVDARLVRKAAKTVHPKDKPMTQAAAVRRVLPWSVIASHLNNLLTRFGQKNTLPSLMVMLCPISKTFIGAAKKTRARRGARSSALSSPTRPDATGSGWRAGYGRAVSRPTLSIPARWFADGGGTPLLENTRAPRHDQLKIGP
jgi:hypothetical protein